MKKIYGIGTGPGASDLLTIRAVKTIEKSDVIFAPHNKGINMALDTAKEYIGDKRIVLLDFPMGQVKSTDYEKAAEIIVEEIPEGGSGSFLTIGDPMIYSTFIYLMEHLEDGDIEIEVVSGIPSFIAASAASKSPLVKKAETFLLCDELEIESLDRIDSIAVLKTSKDKQRLIDGFEAKDFSHIYVKRASSKAMKIFREKEDILNDNDYISLILGRKKG